MGNIHNGPERRSARRFKVELELRYRAVVPPSTSWGAGKTLDISRKGILFAADDSLAPSTLVEIVVDWPANTKGGVPLNLTIRGQVVRIQKGAVHAIAVKFRRYEFVACA